MDLLRLTTKSPIHLNSGAPVGAGGEATVYSVANEPEFVAKIYHDATSDRVAKLQAMLANPPEDPMRNKGHVSIAWPEDLLIRRDNGQPLGYLMPRAKRSEKLLFYYNQKRRLMRFPHVSYQSMVFAAFNLASAVTAIHNRGYVIGDVNESNVLIDESALVTLVDTDSFQVRDATSGQTFLCPVFRSEYLAPELQGMDLSRLTRHARHDLFGIGVLMFQLLMGGTHPFDGIYLGAGNAPEREDRIVMGLYPYSSRRGMFAPSPLAPPIETLSPELRNLFSQCFESGHSSPEARPSAREWKTVLESARNSLLQCSLNPQHWFSPQSRDCPWCAAARRGGDPFPSPEAIQRIQQVGLQVPLRNNRFPAATTYPPPTPVTNFATGRQPHPPPIAGQAPTPRVPYLTPVNKRSLINNKIVVAAVAALMSVGAIWLTGSWIGRRYAGPVATTATLDVSCDLDCTWQVNDGPLQENIKAGGHVTATIPPGEHTISAAAAENPNATESYKTTAKAGETKLVTFKLDPKRRKIDGDIEGLFAKAKALDEKAEPDIAGEVSIFRRIQELAGNQNASVYKRAAREERKAKSQCLSPECLAAIR